MPADTPLPLYATAEGAAAGPAAAWRVVLLTAAAYAAAGLLALLLAIPPSYASPLFPAAGVAVAAVLVHGRPALGGVVLGALVVHLALLEPRGPGLQWAWLLPLVSSLGAGLQAACGAWLAQRWVGRSLLLAELPEIGRFFLGTAFIACLVNPTLSTATMVALGLLPAAGWVEAWWTWWCGDALGVLIGAPITLAMIGQPRGDWVPRRLTVALPLVVTSALMGVGTGVVGHWEAQRARHVFERDAAMASAALQARLSQAHSALRALNALYLSSDDVSADEFERASRPWLQDDPALQALGFSQSVKRSEVAQFEARVKQEDGRSLRVFDRPAPEGAAAAPPSPVLMVVRHIEPAAGNEAARGVNSMSVPAARAAIEAAMSSWRPVMSAPFPLTQWPSEPTGAVLYQALHEARAGQQAALPGKLLGVVFVTVRPGRMLAVAAQGAAAYLQWCLIDTQAQAQAPTRPSAQGVRLAGPPACEAWAAQAAQPMLVHRQVYSVGERQWQLVLQADPAHLGDVGRRNAWLFATTGLASAAVLSALLLTVTGRTRRIETAVAERTADLQREVTERVRTAGALQASEQRLRSIFDHAPVGIVFADLDARVQEVNPHMRSLLGRGTAELLNHDLLAIGLPDDREALLVDLQPLLRGEVTDVARRARLHHLDGSWRWVDTRWSMLRGSREQPLWLVAVVEDISERLKREEAEQGRQVAESANRAKNEFLSRMSHELRTPLNAMLGFAQLLQLDKRAPLAPHQAGWTRQILQAGWHLLEMINDTLDLSRIEAGVVALQARPLMLRPVLDQCLALVGQAAAARQIQLHLDLAANASVVMGDDTRVKQVLTNLLSNAVKYNSDGGTVRVRSRRTAHGQVALEVRDTGPGLLPGQLAQLFQPFNRLGQERGATEGTGIGLVISRRLAELMGGGLQADSVPGEGATFTLYLPAADAGQVAQPALPLTNPTVRGYHHRQVLFIEDNQANVEVMQGILKQRPQVQLRVCSSAQAGLAAMREHAPDLLLLDMHLPDMDGLALLAQLKDDTRLSDMPVLAVSADATPARIQAALAAGACGYITKPVRLGEFLAALDELLEAMDTRAAPLGTISP